MAVQMDKTHGAQEAYEAYGASKADKADKTEKKRYYGKTVGEPQLSEKAQKYYDSLKKKYGNYDFILVSKDQKDFAQANAARYANKNKTVVLIDEEKIERMASDEDYRKKYEGVLDSAKSQLAQLKAGMEKSGANVKGYGMKVNDGGTASFFAVLKKSSADQRERIEKRAAERKAEKKAAEKKAARKDREERIHGDKAAGPDREREIDEDDTVVVTADSAEELMKKVEDFRQNELMDTIQTEEEKLLGQHFDFKG